jgi:hypothetical protein
MIWGAHYFSVICSKYLFQAFLLIQRNDLLSTRHRGEGNTALHHLMQYPIDVVRMDVVELLVDSGADLCAQQQSETPADTAARCCPKDGRYYCMKMEEVAERWLEGPQDG